MKGKYPYSNFLRKDVEHEFLKVGDKVEGVCGNWSMRGVYEGLCSIFSDEYKINGKIVWKPSIVIRWGEEEYEFGRFSYKSVKKIDN
jgi:hypothetical protein